MWTEITNRFQKYVETGEFDADQLSEILEGLKEGVEVITFAYPEYDAGQMQQIRFGLSSNVPVKYYADTKYTAEQMREIRISLEDNLELADVLSIANPKYRWDQMREIRECYKERISLSEIKMIMNPEFDPEQMTVLRETCKKGEVNNITLRRIANPEYDADKMRALVQYYKYGHDLTLICDPSYSLKELEFFNKCFDEGLELIDIKGLLSKALSHDRRLLCFYAYQNMNAKFAFITLNPEYDDDQIEDIIFMLNEKNKILYEYKNIWTNDNEENLLSLLKYNSKGTTSKLFNSSKTLNLDITDGNLDKWNVSKLKNWKTKVLKIYKEIEKYYIK